MMPVYALIAFLGGAVSITSPCTLPLLPPFLAYMAGASAGAKGDAGRAGVVRAAGRAALFMSGVLVVFAASANPETSIGTFTRDYKELFTFISGIFILALGVVMLRRQAPAVDSLDRRLWAAVPAGVAFGFISIACCLGRIISAILMTDSSVNRNMLLIFFVAGLGLVFLFVGLLAHGVRRWTVRSDQGNRRLRTVAGATLAIVGVLVISGIWSARMLELQRYAAATQTLPVQLEHQLLEHFKVAR